MAIHSSVPDCISRYDIYARGGRTRYSREEVEAAYADLQAADETLDAAIERAAAILDPHWVKVSILTELELDDWDRYGDLYRLMMADSVTWAERGHGREIFPLTEWAKVAACSRAAARRIDREIARLHRSSTPAGRFPAQP